MVQPPTSFVFWVSKRIIQSLDGNGYQKWFFLSKQLGGAFYFSSWIDFVGFLFFVSWFLYFLICYFIFLFVVIFIFDFCVFNFIFVIFFFWWLSGRILHAKILHHWKNAPLSPHYLTFWRISLWIRPWASCHDEIFWIQIDNLHLYNYNWCTKPSQDNTCCGIVLGQPRFIVFITLGSWFVCPCP